ncbi:MlaE family ABC transporter permease [Amycolatopsis sp. NPDC059657]|uniref:MlaE family ABC transporter permease n=1 Tax=Amycolatopsis sp. NPDC059657 TaxID=3346899 RepID=UPI003670423F
MQILERVPKSFVTFGRVLVLAVDALRYIPHKRFPWKEFVRQAWFITSVSMVPTLLVAVPFGVIVSVQVGSISQQVGATSFMGAANGLGVIRQGAPIVVALLLAGAVGSAICADLGARKIRDEIDALETMGLSAVQRLVAPRLAATLLVAVLLCGMVSFTGVVTGYVFNVLVQSGTPGSYVATFAAFAQPADLILAELKSVIFGGIVAVVASYKGLTASGGPKGVANAVNAAVVLSVVLLFAVNVIITQLYAVLFPQRIA